MIVCSWPYRWSLSDQMVNTHTLSDPTVTNSNTGMQVVLNTHRCMDHTDLNFLIAHCFSLVMCMDWRQPTCNECYFLQTVGV